jgi:hypothetical protein
MSGGLPEVVHIDRPGREVVVALDNDRLVTLGEYDSIPNGARHARPLIASTVFNVEQLPNSPRHFGHDGFAGRYGVLVRTGRTFMQSVLIFIHILSAGTWLGTNVVQAVTNDRMAKESDEVAAGWLTAVVRWGTVVYAPAAVPVLVTGIWMVTISNGAYRYESLFVVIGFGMIVIGVFFGNRIFGPQSEKAAALRSNGQNADSIYSRLRTFGLIDMVLLLVTFAAMVGRWGA